MENFWDFSVWSGFHLIAVLLLPVLLPLLQQVLLRKRRILLHMP